MSYSIHLLNTSVASDNIGDEIITSEIQRIIEPLLTECYVTTSSSHDGLGRMGRQLCAQSEFAFLLGTNALSASPQRPRFIWPVLNQDISALQEKVVCFGVGANKAFDKVHPNQSQFLDKLLSKKFTHSCRDGLGKNIVDSTSAHALNTTCPTLWGVDNSSSAYPLEASPNVVFTLTKHKAKPVEDRYMIDTLLQEYKKVWFWPQQPRDLDYLKELMDGEMDKIGIVPPNLRSYDKFLSEVECDVIGTRLHGTIRGLHHNRRALVVAIDNRALSIGEETSLNTVRRSELQEKLVSLIRNPLPVKLSLPKKEIETFLAQFDFLKGPSFQKK